MSGVLINLDQSKAFDCVDNQYLEAVLAAASFCPVFRDWITAIYCDICSVIKIQQRCCGKTFSYYYNNFNNSNNNGHNIFNNTRNNDTSCYKNKSNSNKSNISNSSVNSSNNNNNKNNNDDECSKLLMGSDNRVIGGRKCDLTASEKFVITSEVAKCNSTLEISEIIGRYHQAMKSLLQFLRRYVSEPTSVSRGLFLDVLYYELSVKL
ncbi:hybrid signal transduction histidine kinase E-like [Octopus sinensis]|uniref:Hybrid signal transduction histidine kinase E-like n=1 Tax=Octopus sinensis TaxID=2607531 RepID=A0A6P7SPW5_9MOLL|nr:hybrid signal transduction histidine kinase E-like [Octopus sinensis]